MAIPCPSFSQVFKNKMYMTYAFLTWGFISVIIFSQLGAFHMQFMTIGPSEQSQLMGMKINTWSRWTFVATYSFLNTACNEFFGNALFPFFVNVIQDHKSVYLPYSKMTCNVISCAFDLYSHVMGIFSVYLLFSQIDFLALRCLADILVTFFTNRWFLQHKIVDPVAYEREMEGVDPASHCPPDGAVDLEMQPLADGGGGSFHY